jgi:hypothetical protein
LTKFEVSRYFFDVELPGAPQTAANSETSEVGQAKGHVKIFRGTSVAIIIVKSYSRPIVLKYRGITIEFILDEQICRRPYFFLMLWTPRYALNASRKP